MTTNTLSGKVALVTGGSRGLGAATCRELAARGAAVAVNYHRSAAPAKEVADGIEAAGGRAVTVPADVTDAAAVTSMVEQVERELGPVDILVPNAYGFDETVRDFPLEIDVEALVDVVSAQVRAAMLPLRAVVPGMVERRAGAVVLISAVVARDPWVRSITHGTAKAAMEAIARFHARYVAEAGVRVNTVIPGVVDTDAARQIRPEKLAVAIDNVPMKRMAAPEEVARVIAALACDDTSYVTGAFVPVCGGSLIF